MWPRSPQEVARILGITLPLGLSDDNGSNEFGSLSTDSRRIEPGDLFVAIRGETLDGHAFVDSALKRGARAALVEASWLSQHQDFSRFCFAVNDTTQALRELARVFRKDFNFPVFAVGGSNGKTTTKEMLAALLKTPETRVTRTNKSENGFLGLAITLTQKAHHKKNPPSSLIAEIGIDAPGAMSEHVAIADPDVALLTALGPEHLAGLGTWENAVREELILFRHASMRCRRVWQLCDPKLLEVCDEIRAGDVVVYNALSELPQSSRFQILLSEGQIGSLSFRVTAQTATSTSLSVQWKSERLAGSNLNWNSHFEVPLPGLHNAQNFALALATAASTGVDPDCLENSWRQFVPPEMRSRIVLLKGGITLYDDCYNASPASMEAAFENLLSEEWQGRHKILILGDMLDLGEESKSWHLKLIAKLLKIENSDLCLFGSNMYDVFKEIKTNHSLALQSGNIQLQHADSGVDPRLFLSKLADRLPGSVVLVKGSRGMDLGRFVKSCEEWATAQG